MVYSYISEKIDLAYLIYTTAILQPLLPNLYLIRVQLTPKQQMGVSKNRGKTPKMDGENNGKPYLIHGWFGGNPPYFRKHP